jgi:agmatinase
MEKRRTRLPDSRVTPRFAGLVTFGRYPRLADVDASELPLDWVIYGVPYDTGVTYRPGARFGPRAIREASQYLKAYSIEHDVDLLEVFSLADAGDAPVEPYSPAGTLDAVADFASDLASPEHTKLMAIGGDHSIAYANLRATHLRNGLPTEGLCLLHFDSHLDTVDQVWGERYGHASPFIRAIEDGLIDPTAMLSIGIKGPLNSRRDLDYARDHGVRIVTADQWRERGSSELEAFKQRVGDRPVYITFDIDCVDPAYAPGTGTPSIGGFTSVEVLAAIRAAKGLRVVGADVVEVLPALDVAQNTALLAAHVVFEILALDAAMRSPRAHKDNIGI